MRRIPTALSILRMELTVALLSILGTTSMALGASEPQLPEVEAVRLAEAYRLVDEVGEQIWPGFAEVPFPVLLVTTEREYLVDWEKPAPPGFEPLGIDTTLQKSVLSRPRTFSPGMEASFPAFGPPAVVVFGTAEATGRISTEWVLTVLHEHLHQLQYAAPGYYAETEALDLAGADDSGMWMLNYPFPYEDAALGREFGALAEALRAAWVAESDSEAASRPWALLRKLLARLEPADARYLSFQLWQEGIGRYVEWKAAHVAAMEFEPSLDFAALPDAIGWDEAARMQERRTVRGLESGSLADDRRVFFYPIGAAFGALLDRQAPGWKERYRSEKFALHRYLDSGTEAPD